MTLATPSTRRYLSPGQVAEFLAVDLRQVLRWIRSRELVAVNVVGRIGKRPRWRISTTDLDLFLLRRTASPTTATPRRRRQPEGVTEYFR